MLTRRQILDLRATLLNSHRLKPKQPFGFCEVVRIVRHLSPGGLSVAEVYALPLKWALELLDEIPSQPGDNGPSPEEITEATGVIREEREVEREADYQDQRAKLRERHRQRDRQRNLQKLDDIRHGRG